MRQRGMTLIELMVTLTVLGLLLMGAVPAMSEWMRNTRIRNAAEAAQNGLSKARMEAMRRNQAITFWMVSGHTSTCSLSSSSSSWVVSVDDPSNHCTDAASSSTVPRIVEAYGSNDGASDVLVSAAAGDASAATSVSFNGFGQVVSTGSPIATIDLTNANLASRNLRVTISAGGAIRMCDPLVTAPDSRACS